MPESPPPSLDLSLAEWVVLALVDESPTHGFALVALTRPDGALGRVWTLPRPVVYRALPRLADLGLLSAGDDEPGRGPARHPYAVTAAGREEVRRWLRRPVAHVREVRSELLLKMALLERRGEDARPLLRDQRAVLEPIREALDRPGPPQAGFDATLAAWRAANVRAVVDFLDSVLRES